jgi:formiminotetrahydrofolate cyclodeaminase
MITDDRCTDFLTVLASAAPVPGGGGASAFVGAMGTALGCMVANLTLGKKKYQDVQEDIKRIIEQAESLRAKLTELVEKDAEVFEPLSKAYGLPKETEEQQRYKEATLESALKAASGVPYEIMERAMEAMDLHEELAKKGTRIAVSDVGVGVQFCKAALMGASLNVYINTKLMKDRPYAEQLNRKVEAMLQVGMAKADRIYQEVEASLK